MLPLDFAPNSILVSECLFKLVFIVKVAGDQRLVVRKRHSWNNFEQIVTVAYPKKKQISLERNCVEVSF